jgi:hypothetical protein
MVRTVMMKIVPKAEARAMFHRSGKLAKRHRPLYSPVDHRTSPCTASTSTSSVIRDKEPITPAKALRWTSQPATSHAMATIIRS